MGLLPQQEQKAEEKSETESEKAKRKEIEEKACPAEDIIYIAKTDKKSHPTADIPADKALIYVVRPTMIGHTAYTKLAVDGHWIGVNRGKNYFFFTLEPGEHYFCSKAENRSALALTVEAGKTYYLQQKILMGFLSARNHLAVLDEEEGKEALAKCHPSSFHEKPKKEKKKKGT